MEMHVFPTLVEFVTTTVMFNLWMSKIGIDTFALVINFIDDNWVPCQVIIDMFETPKTFKVALAEQMKSLFTTYELTNKVIVYVKDEGTNLNMLAFALTNVVSCELLQLPSPFSGTFFGHVMSKDMPLLIKKIGVGMKKMSVGET